jgi:hypothetical protein
MRHPGVRLGATAVAAAALCLAAPAWAWWPAGHTIITKAAVKALPPEVPAFFRSGGGMIGHCAQDPDVAKNRATPNLNDRESPEHFIDSELMQGRPLPATRSEFVQLCAREKIDPQAVGFVPYAIAEWTERLAVAFAEHRKWPQNPYIQQKCLLYAGFLAHYAEDLCMPLHTTIHHDGRARADGSSPRSGIHAKVDSLPEKMKMQPDELAKDQKIEPVTRLMPAIVAEMEASHALVERVYQLEDRLPPSEGPWTPGPEITAFATERARESARFTASLFLTAWQKSARIQLPPWLERE